MHPSRLRYSAAFARLDLTIFDSAMSTHREVGQIRSARELPETGQIQNWLQTDVPHPTDK